MKQEIINTAKLWAVSGVVSRLAVPVLFGLALVAGEGSIAIQWGIHE
ncbi:hypothetical protein [Aliamphritea ceti]|nr:hypothetical protein [Aliamphritea ceti]